MKCLTKATMVCLSALAISGCVTTKTEYMVMSGANPIYPKEQALAQCQSQAEQIARQDYQQRLQAYNQRKQQYQQQFTANTMTNSTSNCYGTGANTFNCNTTSYNNSGMGNLLGQVAAGSGPTYSGARRSDIDRCMAGMGFNAIKVEQPLSW